MLHCFALLQGKAVQQKYALGIVFSMLQSKWYDRTFLKIADWNNCFWLREKSKRGMGENIGNPVTSYICSTMHCC